jgi:hypothetical protein
VSLNNNPIVFNNLQLSALKTICTKSKVLIIISSFYIHSFFHFLFSIKNITTTGTAAGSGFHMLAVHSCFAFFLQLKLKRVLGNEEV